MDQTVAGTFADDMVSTAIGDVVHGDRGHDRRIAGDMRSVAFDPADPTSGSVTFIDDTRLFFAAIEDVLFDDGRNGIMDRTAGADATGAGYIDAGGDAIDADDAILPDEAGHDDFVQTGGGDGTVFSTLGDDEICGGAGADVLHGGDGKDLIDSGDQNGPVLGGDDRDALILERGATVAHEAVEKENRVVTFLDGGTLSSRYIETVVIPCLTPGTMIQTDRGDMAVEAIVPGDQVLRRDRGYQAIRWVGRRQFRTQETETVPHLVPVRIAQGGLWVRTCRRATCLSRSSIGFWCWYLRCIWWAIGGLPAPMRPARISSGSCVTATRLLGPTASEPKACSQVF